MEKQQQEYRCEPNGSSKMNGYEGSYLQHGGLQGQAAERAVKQGLVEFDDELDHGAGGQYDRFAGFLLILIGFFLNLFIESEVGGWATAASASCRHAPSCFAAVDERNGDCGEEGLEMKEA
jgi:hypothetical protein